MQQHLKKYKRLLIGAMVSVAILLLGVWVFGWGGGDINVLKFSADDVTRLELNCTDTKRVELYKAVVTEPEDIQACIDWVNAFQHTGSAIKELFRHGIGIGLGGTCLYTFQFYLLDEDPFILEFGNNDGEQEISDVEVSYWRYTYPPKKEIPSTCRGSLEPFYELYEKYRPAN